MPIINTVTEAVIEARNQLVKINGVTGVVMFQVESVNLINYSKNEDKPTWRVKCSFYTDLSGIERVSREVYIDKGTGAVVDMNGSHGN